MLLRRHFQVSPNSVFCIYNVLCMRSTLKGNRYITHLMLTLLLFFFFLPLTHYHKFQTKEIS